MSKKVWGKRVAQDESTQKKRRTADVAPRKPGGISLDDDQTARTQSVVMSKWLDDDEAPIAPTLSTQASSRNMCMEVQSEGGEGVPEQ